MARIDAPVGRVLGQLVNQVADIVQQGRHHQRVGRAGRLGVMGRLQGVLQLRNRLADISGVPLGGEQLANLVDDVHVGTRRCILKKKAAATLVSSPIISSTNPA